MLQSCGAGAGGAEIIWDLEPELKLPVPLKKIFTAVCLEDARMKKN